MAGMPSRALVRAGHDKADDDLAISFLFGPGIGTVSVLLLAVTAVAELVGE